MDLDFDTFTNPSEKGFDTIVLQIGSHSIKFGYSTQYQPFIVPNVIAYKIIKDEKHQKYQKSKAIKDYKDYTNQTESILKEIQDEFIKEISREERIFNAKNKHLKINTNSINPFAKEKLPYHQKIQEKKIHSQQSSVLSSFRKQSQMMLDLNDDITDNIFKWTEDILEEGEYLIGRAALSIPNEMNYEIRNPIKYGYFNNDYLPSVVVNDLEKILSYCFYDILKLERKSINQNNSLTSNDINDDLSLSNDLIENKKNVFHSQSITDMNLILIIPDVFIKQQIKLLLNLLFKKFQYKNIFLQTEAVSTTFGVASPIACIVDIGSSKVNISCVDEGYTIQETLIRRNYGGDDINSLLEYQFMSYYHSVNSNSVEYDKERVFPIDEINTKELYYHKRIIEKLKEDVVMFPNLENPSVNIPLKPYKLWIHKFNKDTDIFNLMLREETVLPSLILFKVDYLKNLRIFKPIEINGFNDINNDIFNDPEDAIEDLINDLINDRKDEVQGINFNSDKFQSNSKTYKMSLDDMNEFISLDEMIAKSIMSIHNPELRKRMANSIILTGGGSKIPYLVSYLEEKLISKLTEMDSQIERVEILNLPSFDNKIITWIGSSVVPKLDSIKKMWINRDKWLCDVNSLKKNEDEEEDKEKDKDGTETKENKNNEKTNEKEKNRFSKKKKDRFIDAGLNLLRQKTVFVWSNQNMN